MAAGGVDAEPARGELLWQEGIMKVDMQTITARRARAAEQIEARIGRSFTQDEKLAFEIGFNSGAELAIEAMREQALEALGVMARHVEGGR